MTGQSKLCLASSLREHRSHVCPECEYPYDEATGNPREGFPAGTPWTAVPDTWNCPDCGVREKRDFEPAQ